MSVINSIVTDDFLGFSAGTISNQGSLSRYAMEQKNVYKIIRVERGIVRINFNDVNLVLRKNQCLTINSDISLIISSVEDFQISFVQFKDSCFNKNHDISFTIKNSKIFDDINKYNKFLIPEKHNLIIDHYLDLLYNSQISQHSNFNYILAQNTLQQIILLSISIFDSKIPKCNKSKNNSFTQKIFKLFNETIFENVKTNRYTKN